MAGLVHDVADIAFPDDHADHASRGAGLVEPLLGARVAHLVAAHVDAKRYLVATDPSYRAQLSPRSVQTLQLQGDALDAPAVDALASDPDLAAILALRRADEQRQGSARAPTRPRHVAVAPRAGRAMSNADFDVVVVGGGHNGLVAAGLLARRGARVTVLERRSQVGGAATTEQPWGPDFNVTALSYVVSLMPPTIVKELELAKHGYKVYPQHGYFAPYRDGRALQLPDHDPGRRREQIAQFSKADVDGYERWDSWLGSLAEVLGPLLTTIPPRLGSRRAHDLVEQLQLAWRLRGLGVEGTADVTRLFTMSIADLLDEYFESSQMKGVLAVSGVIGTWAGPRSAGTAYVMAHHKIGDVGEGQLGSWGFPGGRHGRGEPGAARCRDRQRRDRAHGIARRPHRRARRPGAGSRRSSRARSSEPTWSSPRPIPRSPSWSTSTRRCCRPTSSGASSAGARAAAP